MACNKAITPLGISDCSILTQIFILALFCCSVFSVFSVCVTSGVSRTATWLALARAEEGRGTGVALLTTVAGLTVILALVPLPFTVLSKLSNSCYQQMFWGCSLTDAPILPATDLSNNCYQTMFCDCASLTTAPILPATTLANTCYERMFFNCTHLTVAPELPITTLTDDCYKDMFSGSGLIKAPKLPATTLMKGCYQQMFKACPDLVIPPQIPDTLTLPELSCVAMFKGCHKLQVNNIGKGTKFFTCPRDVLPESIADDMFEGTSGDFKGTPVAGESYYYTVD